jgi:hypothetical protein
MALMGKKSLLAFVAMVTVLGSMLAYAVGSAGGTETGKDIRILYVGRPGTEREKDFVDFLSKHFGTVAKGDLAAFVESQSKDFDVTIFDYDRNDSKAPRPQLSEGFSRPVLTVGIAGAFIGTSLNLKTGFM